MEKLFLPVSCCYQNSLLSGLRRVEEYLCRPLG